MTIDPPVCMRCLHYQREEHRACDAFPQRIPDLIWLKGNPHTQPVAGDHGIRFEAKDDALHR